jgi:hypothetical protein
VDSSSLWRLPGPEGLTCKDPMGWGEPEEWVSPPNRPTPYTLRWSVPPSTFLSLLFWQYWGLNSGEPCPQPLDPCPNVSKDKNPFPFSPGPAEKGKKF